jgi:Glycosyl transferase family 2
VPVEVRNQVNTDESAELSRLQNQVVAQARELALLRYEISALLTRDRIGGTLQADTKRFIKFHFPNFARGAERIGVAVDNLILSWRPKTPKRALAALGDDSLWSTLRGPLLLVGDEVFRKKVADYFNGRAMVLVSAGSGPTRSLPVPQSDEPPLRAAAPGSLVTWSIENPGQLRRMNTIVVDAADELSLGLLRGRLVKGQTLVLFSAAPGHPAVGLLATELGAPSIDTPPISAFSELPGAWLDPLDENGSAVSRIVERITWPKISVVMVSYNQEAFLEEGIQSILRQEYPNLEFIVVDGNSTDGSINILNRYRDRVDKLIIESDCGQSDGLNKGFSQASGEILAWVNSDDLLEPGALFRVAQAFSFYGTDMVAGGCRQIGLSRKIIIANHHSRLPFGLPVALPLGLLLEMDRFVFAGSFFYQPEVFFSHRIWENSGGKLRTDLHYVLDYDLWVRMAAAGATVVHIPDFLACSRTHDQQKTTVGMPQMPEVQRLLRDYCKRFLHPPFESVSTKP